jgi:hypothetical protein
MTSIYANQGLYCNFEPNQLHGLTQFITSQTPKRGNSYGHLYFPSIGCKTKARVMTCCGSTIFNSKLTINLSWNWKNPIQLSHLWQLLGQTWTQIQNWFWWSKGIYCKPNGLKPWAWTLKFKYLSYDLVLFTHEPIEEFWC